MSAISNEKLFYDTLEKIFTGAQVQGKGGFINLLAIKHSYYKKVLQIFKAQIKECGMTDDTREELFDRLYTFFKKYFSECGSVYYCQTAYSDKVYEKVYTNNKDVVLFYKTSMLYYVKSETLFQNMAVSLYDSGGDKNTFVFDARNIQNKKGNEKKELVFTFDKVAIPDFITNEDGEPFISEAIILNVAYSENGTKTNLDNLARQTKIDEKTVKKALDTFKKQSSVDYFINKDAKKFLTEQLDLYTHQILLNEKNEFSEYRLKQLKTFKDFAQKIIDFVSQFENELVKVWNKPKFPRSANYVITLDRLEKLSGNLLQKVAAAEGLKAQIKEWQDLGMVDDTFDFNNRSEGHAHLPLDTKYFKELEAELLSQFDNLDEALDGRLIHSENYQALNTLKGRYKEKVQCVYIDPPFNTGSDFAYIDNYQDTTWLSIMSDRLELAREFLKEEGSLYLHLDFNADYRGRELCDNIFGNENFLNMLSWGYRSGGASKSTALPYKHDSILYYSKDAKYFRYNPVTERQYYEKSFMGCKKDENGRFYSDTLLRDCFEGVIFDPILNMEFNTRKVLNLSHEFFSFENSQKPEGLLHLLQTIASNKNEIVMDFFAGSGSSLAVAQKTDRKWLGIEMGEHFGNFYESQIEYKNTPTNKIDIYKDFNVLDLEETDAKLVARVKKVGALGRLKEVLACLGKHNPCGISENVNWQGGGFFKYYTMEQYEDTLQKMHYCDSDSLFSAKRPFENYAFLTDEKFSYVLKTSGEKNDIVKIDFNELFSDIDFAESISLAKGLPIKQIKEKSVTLSDGKEYSFDFEKMTAEEKVDFIQMLKPFLWWGE